MKHIYFALNVLACSMICMAVAYTLFGFSETKADVWVSTEVIHISSPVIKENGYGLNALFVDLTYKHKGFYFSGGLGVHSESSDCPEVCFGDDFLGRIRIGYELKLF